MNCIVCIVRIANGSHDLAMCFGNKGSRLLYFVNVFPDLYGIEKSHFQQFLWRTIRLGESKSGFEHSSLRYVQNNYYMQRRRKAPSALA